jgi:capsular polysaccharide biosynthesis protein
VRNQPAGPDDPAVVVSEKLFERLLAAYPEAHRREFGPAMAQLFRDQCREAWRAGRGWGLTRLWLRVLPDLLKTSLLEHLLALKERKGTLDKVSSLLRLQSTPRSVFWAVFALVFLTTVATSTLVTFLLPDTYASSARIKVDWTVGNRAGQEEFEVIQSEPVLRAVITQLDLNSAWGRKHAQGAPLPTSETMALLKARIDLRPVRGTDLIQIRAFSDQPAEAALLANAVADSYRAYRSQSRVELVDQAMPGVRPALPNRPRNIAFAVLGGMLFAALAGTAIAGFAAWLGRRSGGRGAPTGPGTTPPAHPLPAENRRTCGTVDRAVGAVWMGMGGLLAVVALAGIVWLLVIEHARLGNEFLFLPLFGLCWAGNAVLGFQLRRGKRWARICLGTEGVLLLIYSCFRHGLSLPHCLAWPVVLISQLGTFLIGVIPYTQWLCIPLGLASVCALLWPRRQLAPSPC